MFVLELLYLEFQFKDMSFLVLPFSMRFPSRINHALLLFLLHHQAFSEFFPIQLTKSHPLAFSLLFLFFLSPLTIQHLFFPILSKVSPSLSIEAITHSLLLIISPSLSKCPNRHMLNLQVLVFSFSSLFASQFYEVKIPVFTQDLLMIAWDSQSWTAWRCLWWWAQLLMRSFSSSCASLIFASFSLLAHVLISHSEEFQLLKHQKLKKNKVISFNSNFNS